MTTKLHQEDDIVEIIMGIGGRFALIELKGKIINYFSENHVASNDEYNNARTKTTWDIIDMIDKMLEGSDVL